MVEIIWTQKSVNDLRSIYSFISQNSVFYATLTIQKIRNKTKILSSNKFLGKVLIEFQNQNLREIYEGNYRIIYQIDQNEKIIIVTVLHFARKIKI